MGQLDPTKLPRHIAIIPDGNGRWAELRKLPRNEGHRVGSEKMRDVVRAVHELGVRELTVYAFSAENWARPAEEVDAIMDLLADYLDHEVEELAENGVRLRVIGRPDELPPRLRHEIDRAIARTEGNDEMVLTIALSYGGRTELADAAQRVARDVEAGRLDPDAIDEKCFASYLYAPDMSDPDLLIRAGGERRISNLLLWQLAYTELFFTERMWPDFGKSDLVDAIVHFQSRERRFGRTGAQAREKS